MNAHTHPTAAFTVRTIDPRNPADRAVARAMLDGLCAGSRPVVEQPRYRTMAEAMAATDAAAARWKASADPDVALAQWRARTAERGMGS